MRVDLFDFDLPEDRIALRPARPRDAARLLAVRPDALEDRIVRDLPDLLRPGDALVVNDTRVIPAELHGERFRDGNAAHVSVTLHKREGSSRWRALARPAKRLAPGDRIRFGQLTDNACLASGLDATVEARNEAEVTLRFDLSTPLLDEAIAAVGHIPLPPYIAGRRAEDAEDRRDYQTVYAREEGAVAAPTAGLHFTPELLERLDAAGIARHTVTLHVGAGTFLPVKADDTADHHMHSFAGETSIFITPVYRFRAVDLLMTNFHLPRSTLFMLVSAFAGRERMLAAYAHAIAGGYRFYSYGDASLLWPEAT
ncbi:MAG: S-adenosylmethionine:tRNA ribosyltransferase-isomerase [Rhizobiales bacterium]|nr:S-adenosylmethionine:tRNA ribosyltransferase-isomerase [Hyphomicrobiales bacterium]